jgi:xanthine dehydrogenase accessory factor
MPVSVLIRGGGEMATGVACALHRAGMVIAVTEQPRPRAIRRTVAFAEAVYAGRTTVENITGELVKPKSLRLDYVPGRVPVVIDIGLSLMTHHPFDVVVDAVMSKSNIAGTTIELAPLVIGLGPGFEAGHDCHLVVETNRGHYLGRFYDTGRTEPNTGVPGDLAGETGKRVVRAPVDGVLEPLVQIRQSVTKGAAIAAAGGKPAIAQLAGTVRGMMAAGLEVKAGEKIADIDPRGRPEYCDSISDKARLIGLGTLAAILWWRSGRQPALPPNPNDSNQFPA